jgi:hypothetical protein
MDINIFHIQEDGTLEMVRGDTVQFDMDVYEQGAKVNTYAAYFTVKYRLDDDAPVLMKTFNQSSPCVIAHNDTKNLPWGDYWYDIQVVFTDSSGTTQYRTVGAFPFHLKPDVTPN